MVGNLLGDLQQTVEIGAAVEGVFEHHKRKGCLIRYCNGDLRCGRDAGLTSLSDAESQDASTRQYGS